MTEQVWFALGTGLAWLAAGGVVGILLGVAERRRDRQAPVEDPWWTPDQIEESIRRASGDGNEVMVGPLLSVLARHDPVRAAAVRDDLGGGG
jgi:hypothetical protein